MAVVPVILSGSSVQVLDFCWLEQLGSRFGRPAGPAGKQQSCLRCVAVCKLTKADSIEYLEWTQDV